MRRKSLTHGFSEILSPEVKRSVGAFWKMIASARNNVFMFYSNVNIVVFDKALGGAASRADAILSAGWCLNK